jgi:superfamily II DNA or RNA helicase
LVYCGAASVPDYAQDNSVVSDDDIRQIDAVTDLLGNKMNMKVAQFTSKEDIEKRELITSEFSSGENLQALIAIKCLDEGVNIPSIKTAFILASTTNPKEYIQRRGRVLRLSEGKEFAEIYDFITLPAPIGSSSYMTDETKKLSMAMVKNELARAFEFVNLADNFVEGNMILDEIREEYDIQDEDYSFVEEFDYYD